MPLSFGNTVGPQKPDPFSGLFQAIRQNTPQAQTGIPKTQTTTPATASVANGSLQGAKGVNPISVSTSNPSQPQTQNLASVPTQPETPVQTNNQPFNSGTQINTNSTQSNTSQGQYQGMTPIYGPNGQTSYLAPGGTLGPGWGYSQQGNNIPAGQAFTTSTSNLASQQQGNTVTDNASNGLLGIAASPSSAVTAAQDQYNKLAHESPILQAEVSGDPNVAAEVSSGRAQVLGNQLSGQLQGAAQNVQNALGAQGQQITAGTNAANTGLGAQSNQITAQSNAGNLTQPQANAAFFGSPVSGNTVGSGVGGSDLVNNAVQQAIQMANSGTDVLSITSQLQSQYGAPAVQAFQQAMLNKGQGSYNPTTSSAAAQQNAAQGQTYQQKATDLNTTLTQMKNVTAPVLSLINGAGLNQQNNPFFNQSINAYKSQLTNPAAVASLNAGMSELKNYVSQILGSGGDLTPTEIGSMMQSFDPGNFSGSQLNDFLKNLDNYGQARLQGFQQSSQGSYGSNGAYTGAQATPSANAVIPQTNPDNGSVLTSNNPVVQGVGGMAMNALGGIEGLIGNIAGLATRILQ